MKPEVICSCSSGRPGADRDAGFDLSVSLPRRVISMRHPRADPANHKQHDEPAANQVKKRSWRRKAAIDAVPPPAFGKEWRASVHAAGQRFRHIPSVCNAGILPAVSPASCRPLTRPSATSTVVRGARMEGALVSAATAHPAGLKPAGRPAGSRRYGKYPLRNPQLLARLRRDRQRVPLVGGRGVGVEDELVLLAQLLRQLRVDGRQLALASG